MAIQASQLDLLWCFACVLSQHLRYTLAKLRQGGVDAFECLTINDNLQQQQQQQQPG
jgi:hypothetical protein